MAIVARIMSQPKDAVAVVLKDRKVTYAEFARDIERVAAHLRAEGLKAGSTVGIHFGMHRESDDYGAWIAHLASLRIGATHATVYDGRHLSQLFECGDVDALIGTMPGSYAGTLRPKVIAIDLPSLKSGDGGADEEASAARLNMTSGTTGRPKLVRWDSGMIERRVAQLTDLELFGPETCLDCYLSARTTAGFRYPIATWLAGGSVILSSAPGFTDAERAAHSTLCACSPFQLQYLKIKRAQWPAPERRTVVTLGGRLPGAVRDWALANIAARVIISYGSTEAGNIAHGDCSIIDRHPGAVGFVRKDAEVQVVGADGAAVPAGTMGRLRLRSNVLAASGGEAASTDGWFEPGDLAILYEDGLLAISGRTSDVVNVGGMKISTADLTAKFAAIDGVEDSAAGLVPTRAGDTLFVTVVPRQGLAARDLMPSIRKAVPLGVPFRLILVSKIPRNAMGKVDRRRLIEQIRRNAQSSQQRQPERKPEHA